jgi:hypothetical protein
MIENRKKYENTLFENVRQKKMEIIFSDSLELELALYPKTLKRLYAPYADIPLRKTQLFIL